jgi:hypothetical protein
MRTLLVVRGQSLLHFQVKPGVLGVSLSGAFVPDKLLKTR